MFALRRREVPRARARGGEPTIRGMEHLAASRLAVAAPTRPWLAVASFAAGAAAVFQFPLNHDVSWIISIAQRVLAGEVLYVDVVELNPPLIVWLTLPLVAAAQLLHVDPGQLLRVVVLAVVAGVCASCARIVHGRLPPACEQALAPLTVYAAVVVAGYDFGQREHLAMLLALPYLALAVLRAQGEPTAARWRIAAAALASIGFVFKPHLLLVPLLVEAVVASRNRRWFDGTATTIGVAACLYAVAVLVFAPAYLHVASMVSAAYGTGYLGKSVFTFIGVKNFQVAALCIVFAAVVRPGPRALLQVLCAATAGFAASALLQAKGWSYHWYPVAALATVLFGLSAAQVLQRRAGDRAPLVVGLAVLALSTLSLLAAPRSGALENPMPAVFSPLVKRLGGGPVMILSNTVRASYPLVTERGVGAALSLPTMAVLSASILAGDRRLEAYLRAIVVRDMLRQAPRVLIVENAPEGMPPSFDFLEYLALDPAFRRELGRFQLVASVRGFRVYRRAGEGGS